MSDTKPIKPYLEKFGFRFYSILENVLYDTVTVAYMMQITMKPNPPVNLYDLRRMMSSCILYLFLVPDLIIIEPKITNMKRFSTIKKKISILKIASARSKLIKYL